ncbi:fumarylacetoacetate hydrolase family protein [Candidatus Bathyarchaeota archaeon]|nr:fumarylacetoacetate hydrolase family protein [Candidatus Bathyarchaeota archaeon]
MKLVSYDFKNETRVGVQSNELIVDLVTASSELSKKHSSGFAALSHVSDMVSFLEGGDSALDEARALVREVLEVVAQGSDITLRKAGAILPLSEVRLRSPIPRPRKNIVCLGLNYHDHWLETAGRRGEPLPSVPVFFTKSPTAVIGPFDDIAYPSATAELDYEVELAVVLGRRGKDIPRRDVFRYVAGYSILNDVSARDLQRKHQQWFRSKSLDTFAPLGPWLTTRDEIDDPHNLDMALKVNGETRQKSNTRNLIFKIPDILETLSQDMTLEPGDVIATGTPAGVALGMSPPRYLNVGDVIEAQITGLGSIRNRVVEKSTRS